MTTGGLRAGETVLIVGIGGAVATAALTIALFTGAAVYVTSSHDWKLERAVETGAIAGVNHQETDTVKWLIQQTDDRGADLVLDSVGTPTWRSSIASLATGGRMCICGATGGDTPDFSIRELYQSHRRIIGAPMGGRADFDTVLDLVLRVVAARNRLRAPTRRRRLRARQTRELAAVREADRRAPRTRRSKPLLGGAMREMGVVSLDEALDYLALLAELQPDRAERAAVRWYGRLETETPMLTLEESQLALAALCAGERDAVGSIRGLLRRVGPALVRRLA